jgi:glycosyltransferase involved in cell wall biosynthesis
MEGTVSIIVPTKNSSNFLEDCLRSIKNQSYDNIELVVVDNFSTDNTKLIATEYTDNVYSIGPERSAQRNFGARKSNGDYLLFVDSDMRLSEDVVSSCIRTIGSNIRRGGVIVPEESFGVGFWAQCKKLERSFYIGIDWIEAARFFDRYAFRNVGGYDEGMISGEDWDLSQRIKRKYDLGRIPELIYHNEGNPSLKKIVKKKYFYAKHFSNYTLKQNTNDDVLKQTGIIHRYKLFFNNPRKLFNEPITGLGMLFMKTCEFMIGSIGFIVAKARKNAN